MENKTINKHILAVAMTLISGIVLYSIDDKDGRFVYPMGLFLLMIWIGSVRIAEFAFGLPMRVPNFRGAVSVGWESIEPEKRALRIFFLCIYTGLIALGCYLYITALPNGPELPELFTNTDHLITLILFSGVIGLFIYVWI